MDIDGFLQRASARPWRWGEHDCTLFAADWVAACTGRDPASGWRGTYSTALGCERALMRAGGLEHVWSEALAAAGLKATAEPRVGDLGLVLRRSTDLAWRPTGAVLARDAWASLTPGGLHVADAPIVAAWRIS